MALGDVGYLNEEGYLFLTDRATFMIVSGGVNIDFRDTLPRQETGKLHKHLL